MTWMSQGYPVTFSFVTGWVFGGIGIIGQPHILVRFMIVDTPGNVNKARAYYYTWYIVFFCLTVIAGLVARILLPATETFDPELALPILATQMLPPIFIGLVLAGLFAATMSTADSQILSCTAAVTRDLFPNKKENMFFTKMSTLAVTLVALVISICSMKVYLCLQSSLGRHLAQHSGRYLFLYTFNKKISERTAIVMMVGGLTTSLSLEIFWIKSTTCWNLLLG